MGFRGNVSRSSPFLFAKTHTKRFTLTVSKEIKQFNEMERYLVQRMMDLDLWRKFANELLLELIRDGRVDRSEEEITKMCSELADALHNADEEETNRRSSLN